MKRRWLSAAFLVVASGVGLAAQPPASEVPESWRGGLGVLVVVTDESGAPLPETEVAIRQPDAEQALVYRTDSEGRAEVRGLAAGEWQVDLLREGFMLFTGYLQLEPGRDPKVAFSSKQRTGSYWEPLSAVFLPPGFDADRSVLVGRRTAEEGRKAQAEELRRARREAEREERRQRRGDFARIVETEPAPPAPEAPPQPAVEPTEAPAVPAAAEITTERPAPAPRPEPALEPAPEPAAPEPAPEPAIPRELDAGGEPSVAPPEPRPLPDAPARAQRAERVERSPGDEPRRRLLRNPDLLPAGACPECQPGEWSVASSGRAAAAERRGADCAAATVDLAAVARRIAEDLSPEQQAFAGSLVAGNGNDVLRLLTSETRDAVAPVVASATSSSASCVVVGVVLPAGARYVGYRYQAGERSVMADCLPGQPCQIGDADWLGPPEIVRTDTITLVYGAFDNRSRRSQRLPRLTVYFEPAEGWLPPAR